MGEEGGGRWEEEGGGRAGQRGRGGGGRGGGGRGGGGRGGEGGIENKVEGEERDGIQVRERVGERAGGGEEKQAVANDKRRNGK